MEEFRRARPQERESVIGSDVHPVRLVCWPDSRGSLSVRSSANNARPQGGVTSGVVPTAVA